MPLTAGDKLGPYELIETIGKGGMGEVFRARDSRLGRDVAVKVSAEKFGERFAREARAIAALNHPNICTLHDVGDNYLVMELVEGESPKGPLPLEEALRIARQICDALEAAHDKGIVHRDLKPGNIKITPQGQVKVLDFGLAKITQASPASAGEDSPTISMAATQAGVILGTAAYMAPEQAKGKPVDKRADIWAFGVVLYELVTGRRLFQGEDLTEVLASVVKEQPDLSAAPPRVRRLLARCLEKDPKKRLRDIGAVGELLDGPVPTGNRRVWLIPTLAAGVLLLMLAALAVVHFRETPPESLSVAFTIDAPPEVSFINVYGGSAPSPDGRYIAFTAGAPGAPPMLWLRPLNADVARPLPGTENGNNPAWSPDSRSLVFRTADGKLKRIDIEGGPPLVLAEAPGNNVASFTGTWSREGVILFGSPEGLRRTSASGGGASLLTKVDPKSQEAAHGYPQFLPDGNHFLYFVASDNPNVQGVYASSLDHPEQRRQIVRTDAKAVFVPARSAYPSYLLWMQEDTLLAQRFDPDSLELEGDPASVAEGIQRAFGGGSIRAGYWASDAGLLIYYGGRRTGAMRSATWIGRDGKQLGEALPRAMHVTVAQSPGGDRIAVEQRAFPAEGDIWTWESARSVLTRLTFDAARDSYPVWSPDGQWVAFASWRNAGTAQIFRTRPGGGSQAELLTEGPSNKRPLDWSRDGRYLLYQDQSSRTGQDLMALPLTGDRRPIPVVQTPFNDSQGFLSPDGRWVFYISNESGRPEAYVRAFPAEGALPGQWQISNSTVGGIFRWRGDGRELYYGNEANGMFTVMAVTVQATPQGIVADAPRELFKSAVNGQLRGAEMSPDGRRFLAVVDPTTPDVQQLSVVSNWQAALRR